MLYHLLTPLAADHIFFNLFNYVTVRAAGAMITAVIISFLLGPAIINWLRVLRFGQVVRTDGPDTHLKKAGTPTMGGVMIIIGTVISTLLWAKLDNPYTLITLGVVPVINENDTVVTDEIKLGDNDTLGAMVTNLIEADALIILTDQAGLFDADPRKNKSAKLLQTADALDPNLESLAGGTGSALAKGGMLTKVLAARRAAKLALPAFAAACWSVPSPN